MVRAATVPRCGVRATTSSATLALPRRWRPRRMENGPAVNNLTSLGSIFRVCKFVNRTGTGRQIKGPPAYFTLSTL